MARRLDILRADARARGRAASLTFLTVYPCPTMSEYAWNTPPSRESTLGRLPSAAVYHRLTPGAVSTPRH